MRINSLHDALKYFPDIDGYWQPDVSKTEAHIQALLPQTPRTAGAVEMYSQLARAQALQGKIDEARATLDQAQRLLAEEKIVDARAELRCMLEQGRLLCLSRNPAKAHDFFVQAWNMANETKHIFFAIDAALMLSTLRPPRFQNEWLQRALGLAQTARDGLSHLWITQLFFLNGWHEFDFRQFDKALESFNRALAQPNEDEAKSFPLYWSKARTMRALGQTQEALAIHEQLVAKMDKRGQVSGHVYLEIAECKQALNAHQEAKTFFEMAYAELSADGWYSDNKSDELARMKYLFKKR